MCSTISSPATRSGSRSRPASLNSHHPFVPVQGTYRADNGDLVVPFDKSTIVKAPYKDTGVAPTRREAEDLARHYELDSIDPNPPTS